MDRETEGTGGQVFTGEESTPLWAHRDLLEGGDRHHGLGEGLGTPASSTFTSLCPLGRGHWLQCNLCPSISSGVPGHSWGQVSAQLLDNPHSVMEFLGEFVCVPSKCLSFLLFSNSDHS